MKNSTCTFSLPQKQRNRFTQKSMAIHYGEFLNTLPWDYFCTFTAPYSLSEKAARRSMGKLKSQLTIQNGSEPTIFWVAEPFDSKHGYHLHALLRDTGKPEPGRVGIIKKTWQKVIKGKYGSENRFTTVLPYDPNLGGHYYVAKYLHRYNADYDFA